MALFITVKAPNYDKLKPRETLKRLKSSQNNDIEKGCTEPLLGEKSKCVLQIVPDKKKCDTFQIDEKCVKK